MKKYLFLPGGLMVVGAVIWAALTLQWDTPAVVLAGGGVLMLAVAIGANWQNVRDWFRDPRGVFVLNSIMSTVLLVVLLVLANVTLSFRAAQIDVTAAGRNTLMPDTSLGLARLGTDVVLKQFGRARDASVDELLAAFANQSRRIHVAFSDAERAPQEARTYSVMRDGTVIVSAGAKWRKVDTPNEPALFQAISQVTANREPMVCVATGDGERGVEDQGAVGLSQLVTSLAAAGYKTDRVSLHQGPLPATCEVLVIAGPSAGLAPEALASLDAYLGKGGRVALMVDPPVNPAVRGWLAQRGVKTGEGMIVETNPAGRQVGAGPESPLALKYFSHPITSGFEVATIYARAVPLDMQKQPPIGIPVALAATGDRAFEQRDLAFQSTEFREGRDRRGPFLLAVASTMPLAPGAGGTAREGRVVVFGDSDFVTNAYLTRLGNRDMLLRTVAWLAGEAEARVVSLSDRQNRRTTMTGRTRAAMYVVNGGILPLLPLIAGLFQFIRNKK